VVSPVTAVYPTNKTDRHDITEILLKVAFNTATIIPNPFSYSSQIYCFASIFFLYQLSIAISIATAIPVLLPAFRYGEYTLIGNSLHQGSVISLMLISSDYLRSY
jgi:hypothetical protein